MCCILSEYGAVFQVTEIMHPLPGPRHMAPLYDNVSSVSASGERYDCHSGGTESYIVNELFPSSKGFYFTRELIFTTPAKSRASCHIF